MNKTALLGAFLLVTLAMAPIATADPPQGPPTQPDDIHLLSGCINIAPGMMPPVVIDLGRCLP